MRRVETVRFRALTLKPHKLKENENKQEDQIAPRGMRVFGFHQIKHLRAALLVFTWLRSIISSVLDQRKPIPSPPLRSAPGNPALNLNLLRATSEWTVYPDPDPTRILPNGLHLSVRTNSVLFLYLFTSTAPTACFWIHPLKHQITQAPARKTSQNVGFAGRCISLDAGCATHVPKERWWLMAHLGQDERSALGRT